MINVNEVTKGDLYYIAPGGHLAEILEFDNDLKRFEIRLTRADNEVFLTHLSVDDFEKEKNRFFKIL
jgi:hypothetical protein